tara:strand:- start:150 stop:347 length:198 start_codon:yes stop_codon:yes gene_type:complete
MDKRKFITVLLVLVIIISLVTIVVNFSADASSSNSPNTIITDPDDNSVSKVGFTIIPKDDSGGSG